LRRYLDIQTPDIRTFFFSLTGRPVGCDRDRSVRNSVFCGRRKFTRKKLEKREKTYGSRVRFSYVSLFEQNYGNKRYITRRYTCSSPNVCTRMHVSGPSSFEVMIASAADYGTCSIVHKYDLEVRALRYGLRAC
jgi:hypothetical protein